ERTNAHLPDPVSGFARHLRLRRRLDTCWTLAALYRGLTGATDAFRPGRRLEALEQNIESSLEKADISMTDLDALEKQIGLALADRLQVRAQADLPGYMILNPCSFTRRVALELEGASAPLPVVNPVKACQLDGSRLQVVVEVPPLGFA